jgi:hypothetical protein
MSQRQESRGQQPRGQESAATVQLGTFQVSTRPLVAGAALIGASAVIGLAGLVITGTVVLAATKRWMDQLEVPPNELARQKWAQARAASRAGASAWQNGLHADARSS